MLRFRMIATITNCPKLWAALQMPPSGGVKLKINLHFLFCDVLLWPKRYL